MSEQDVELLRAGYEAFNAGELDYNLLDPEVEWHNFPTAPEPVFHGREGVRKWRANIADSFEELRIEPEEFIDVGDGRVVVVSTMRGRGKGSGVEVTAPLANVWTLRDGLAVLVRSYTDRAEALAEVGLEG